MYTRAVPLPPRSHSQLSQATVVTADGRILTANESENADLFWGIRGAGSNFGVVTEFVLELYPQSRTVFAGPVIYAPAALEAEAVKPPAVVRARLPTAGQPREISGLCGRAAQGYCRGER